VNFEISHVSLDAVVGRHSAELWPKPSGAFPQRHSSVPRQTQLAKSHFKSAWVYLPVVKSFRCQKEGLDLEERTREQNGVGLGWTKGPQISSNTCARTVASGVSANGKSLWSNLQVLRT